MLSKCLLEYETFLFEIKKSNEKFIKLVTVTCNSITLHSELVTMKVKLH